LPVYDTLGDYSYKKIVKFLPLLLGNAFLLVDRHQNTYFMPLLVRQIIPGISIKGDVGDQIKQNMDIYGDCSVTADFYLRSSYIDDVVSKNVIGTIPGEVDDIVFIGAHYDSVWCQGAADDAGSVSVVWGIAKYISDNYDEIQPHYTLKFAAWGGEDYGLMGSKSYVSKYSNEQTFVRCVNAAAFGYVNDTDITKEDTRFHVYSLRPFPEELEDLIEDIDYPHLSGGYGGVDILDFSFMVLATDAGSFIGHTQGGVFSFDKGDYSTAGHWLHRSGEAHTKGDILNIIDVTEINAATKVVLTTVLYYAKTEYVPNS
jgi:Zn-dependent M28 family amino/carboxypeptidase